MALEEERIGVAEVSSAVELTEDQKERIRKKLLDTTDYLSMRVRYEVDPSLIGGVRVEIEGSVIDGSIKNKLDQIKEVMHR